jgi:hypothetical protein
MNPAARSDAQPYRVEAQCGHSLVFLLMVVLVVLMPVASVDAREKDVLRYGEGLIVNVPLPVDEVTQAVQDVVGNGIIRGTKEYNKDEYVRGAEAATSTPVFPAWTDPGKVFYKVRKQALNPWNFKDSADVGTLAVRYVVQPQGAKNTVLRIDALFVEEYRHSVHQSNGSVETTEYKDIQDHLDAAELLKKETADALKAKEERAAKKDFGLANDTELLSTPPTPGESSSRSDILAGADSTPLEKGSTDYADPDQTPEQHLAALRRTAERAVKKPGAPLKSAPFHSASTLKTLGPGTEVLIEIMSPYWLGVETHEGAHGWVRRDELEQLP